jgi:hypothetical protein
LICFSFEVLDPSNASSTISSTSQTSSSTGTASQILTASSSSSSSSSGTQGPSTVERDLAISMGVVGTLLAVLFIFLLWRFCIRRKGKNGGNMNQITPQYHPVPTISGDAAHVHHNVNSISTMTSDDAQSRYGRDIQKFGSIIILLLSCSNSFFNRNNLYGSPITLSYDRGSSSYSGMPSTLNTNQSGSSSPHSQQIYHDPHDLQRRTTTLSTMTDRPPMYSPSPNFDESAPVSSSSSNSITNEKNERFSRISANTPGADPEIELTTIPGRCDENASAWNSGHPQPLKFVPIA